MNEQSAATPPDAATRPGDGMRLFEEAYGRTIRATTADMAASLAALLGTPLAASLIGATDPETVASLARGAYPPREETQRRLRVAYQLGQLLTLARGEAAARAWLSSPNPSLDERTPAAILATEPEHAPRVMAAARALVSSA